MRIAVSGAMGHMGRAVRKQAESKEIEVIGIDIRADQDEKKNHVFRSFSQLKEKVEVLIDFSSPEALQDILTYAESYKVPCVLCSTGYSEENLQAIGKAAEEIPIFRSSNMSLGVSLISYLAQEAVRILGNGFDIEIIETHHRRKKDAPSGTALMLRDAICSAGGGTGGSVFGRQGSNCKRQPGEIGIHAVRGGTVTGNHEIRFLGDLEQISITHIAEDRAVFAEGAIQAALYLKDKTKGIFTMNDLLGERLAH